MKKFLFSYDNISFRAMVYLICQILSQGLAFLLAPIYTRLLSTDDYGISSVFLTTVSLLSIFIGLQTHGSINNAKVTFPKEEQSAYNSSVISLSCCSFLAFFVLFVVFQTPLSNLLNFPPILVVLLTITAFGSFCIQFLTTYFTANKKSLVYLLISTLIAISVAVTSLLLIINMEKNRYLGKVLGNAVVNITFGIGIFLFIYMKGKTVYNKKYWSFCLPLTLPLVWHAIAGQILAQSDRLMLNSISGSSIAGIYSFCYTIALPLNAAWFALNNTWVPQYYEYMKNKNENLMKKQASNYFFVFTCLAIGFLLVSPEGVKILAPQSYWSGISIVPMVALSCYFTFLYSFAANFEFYHRKTGLISIATVCAALINIILNMILIPAFGMMGAAAATLLAYFFLFIIHEFVARFIIKGYSNSVFFFLKGIIPVLAITILTYIFMDQWVLRWVGAFAVGILLVCRVIKNKGIF